MKRKLKLESMVPVNNLQKSKKTSGVVLLALEATRYLKQFDWADIPYTQYLGLAIPPVVGVFLFVFDREIQDTDRKLWVVVGDLPSAYFVVDQAQNPIDALNVYCDIMAEWATAATNADPRALKQAFPVEAAPNIENANALASRLRFIRERVIPEMKK